jgi:hypothetical protein
MAKAINDCRSSFSASLVSLMRSLFSVLLEDHPHEVDRERSNSAYITTRQYIRYDQSNTNNPLNTCTFVPPIFPKLLARACYNSSGSGYSLKTVGVSALRKAGLEEVTYDMVVE